MNRRKAWSGTHTTLASESVGAATLTRTEVRETTSEAARTPPAEMAGSRMVVHYIRAGWSLNGRYYPADLLRTEGVAAAVPGTQLYIDHASDEEMDQRPAGTVTRIAGTQEGAAWWDEAAQAVAANVRVFRPWRELLTDAAETIGLSVRAWVTSQPGEAQGQRGEIITSIEGYRSVDFVTIPAAGGRIVSVLESVDATRADEARNTGAWFESFVHSDFTQRADSMYREGYLTREERITLSSAIGDALAAFISRVDSDAPQLFSRDPYREPEAVTTSAEETAAPTQEGSTVTTPNVPAAAPADTGTTQTAEAISAQARATVAEAENARLVGAAEATAAAQRQAAEAIAANEQAQREMRTMRANESARLEVGRQMAALDATVPAALVGLIQPRVESAVRNQVPMVAEGDNAGQPDTAGLAAAVTAAIDAERTYVARVLEASGVGAVAGLGGVTDDGGLTDEAVTAELNAIWQRNGMPENAAGIAAKGR